LGLAVILLATLVCQSLLQLVSILLFPTDLSGLYS
jgi:hypothetical protein